MLTQLYPYLDCSLINTSLIGRLRALADDAAHLHSGQPVSPAMLQTAPLLEYWLPVQRPEGIRLIGQIEDRMIITSPLWFADPDGAWIRTLSRFYRLGPPANACETALISALRIEPHDGRDDHEVEDEA